MTIKERTTQQLPVDLSSEKTLTDYFIDTLITRMHIDNDYFAT